VTGDSDAAKAVGLDWPWREVPWIVVDVEGNGQRPPDLVEAACVPIDSGDSGAVRTWMVRPPRPITGPVTRILGIRNTDIANAPSTAAVAAEIRAWAVVSATGGAQPQAAQRLLHADVDRSVPGRARD
jgi:DNA polymerase III epsilon subunit-like protein